MKRQRAALGMAVMMAVSSLSGSYVSASAMEAWQADAEVIPDEELAAEEIVEEAEQEGTSGIVGSAGIEAESDVVTAGSDGLQITGIEELSQEEADQLPVIEQQDAEDEEELEEIEPEAELEGFPGDESLLPGWGYSINSEYDLRIRNAEHPDGGIVRAQITGVWIDDPDELFEYEVWQGENDVSDETTPSGVRLQPEDGNYYVRANDEGRTGEATLTSRYVNEDEGVYGYKTVNLYAVESRYDAGYEFSTGTCKLLPGEGMYITTSLNHRWYISDERRDDIESVEDYTIRLAGADEDGRWISDTAVVTVNDGKTLQVEAKHSDEIAEEADRWSNIPVQYFMDGKEVASAEIGVVVWEDYYQIVAETLEIENPMIDDIVDFSALGISTEHYYLPDESEEEIAVQANDPAENIRYLLEYDPKAWEVVSETETQGTSEDDAEEAEQYGLLKLKRIGNWDTTVTVIAQNEFVDIIDGEENAYWDEVDRLEYHFDQIDYNSWFDFSYESNTDVGNILLYGEGSEPLTVSLNWKEMKELEVAAEDIEWTVLLFDGEDENGTENLAAYGIEAAVAEDHRSVTLTTVDNRERNNIGLWVEARISKYGNELTRPSCDISVAKTEFDVDGLPGDDERLVPGWGYNIDPEYQIFVRDPQHPGGEDIPIVITEAWIQDEEGIIEYNPELDEAGGEILSEEYGVKLQEEDGYHLRAKQDWTKVPEGSATLTYSYAFFNDAGEASYSGQKSVQLGVITERYDHSYRFEDGREELLPGENAYIDTTLYYTRYDVDTVDYQEEEIEDYTVTLQRNEDGTAAWEDNLVKVSFEGTRIKVTASEKCTEWHETWIPVDYWVGYDKVYSDSIQVSISPDYYVITPEKLLTPPDDLGECSMLNVLVGETINFASDDLGVTALHYYRTAQGNSTEQTNIKEEVDVDGKQFRYHMEYDPDAWEAEDLSDGEENGYLAGIHTLRRIQNRDTSVRITLEEYKEDEENGERNWEERIGRDYWFSEVDYEPSLTLSYGEVSYGEADNVCIYTEGDGLTLTFDSIVSNLPEISENSEEGNAVYKLEWNVYNWGENDEQISVEYIDVVPEGNSLTLKAGEDIEQHIDERFRVEAILRAYDEEVARAETEICVKEPEYRFEGEPLRDSNIYLLAGLQEQESAQYFQKDSDGIIWLKVYENNEDCPGGQLYPVQLNGIEFENEEDATSDIIRIEPLENGAGFKVKGGQNPGDVKLKFNIADEYGKLINPIYCTAHVRTEYIAVGDWIIDSPTHAGTNLLPGQWMTVKMDVYYGGTDEDGKFYERKMEENEYNIEFCDYDENVIQIEDGVIYAKNRGETWLGVRITDANTGEEICYDGVNVFVSGKFYSMEPVDIGTIILAPGDKAVDIPLSATKWSISNPDGEQVTEELIYSLPEETNERQDGFETSIREKENGETILHLEFAKDSTLAKGQSAWQTIQIDCSMGDDIIAQRAYNVLLCNHAGKELARTDATCTTDGTVKYQCEACGTEWHQTIPATGHKPVTDAAVAATCTTAGKTAGSHCSVCNTVLEEQQTIPATGHTAVTDAAVAATCTTAGKTAGSHCSVCNTVLQAQQIIPAKGHSWSAWKTISEATIFAAAVQEQSCTTCGTTQRQNAGSALGPKLTLNATSIALKTSQKTTKVKVTELAQGDSVESWTSSDTKVVKVSGTASGTCTITAQKKTGKATIYVKLRSGLTGTIQVKVQKTKVATTKVVVTEKTVKLQTGQKQKINVYIQPLTTEDKLTFTSSNKKVATVSKDGTITTKKAGKANITVKAGKKKVTVKVTVQAPTPTGINGVPATKTLKKGKSFTIKPKLTPSGAEAKITYSSSNKKVATVNTKGKVTAKGKGTAVITVKAGSIVRTCEITVK